MPNNNNLINLVNNKKPVELVQELEKYEIKKSPLSLAARAKVIKRNGGDYQSSRMSSGDIALKQMYGPGFWDDFLRPVLSGALSISYATPFAVVTVPVSIGVGVVGATAATFSDDSGERNVGRQMLGVVAGAAIGHLDGSGSEVADRAGRVVNYIRNR